MKARRGWAWLTAVGIPLLLRALGGLPLSIVEPAFAFVSITQAVLRPSRFRHALKWAGAQKRVGLRKWGLALALLANRGRFIVLATIGAFLDPDQFGRLVRVEGLEYLENRTSSRGVILLSFHIGPKIASRALSTEGYVFATAGWGELIVLRPPDRKAWNQSSQGERVAWPGPDRATRAIGLYRLRRLLLSGKMVRVTADGGGGTEAFRINVPGGAIAIMAGWWTLRRLTDAETIPLLAHREGRRLVLVIHPPLPPPVSDPIEDARMCQQALSSLLEQYVRMFPAQCHSVAFGSLARLEPSDGY